MARLQITVRENFSREGAFSFKNEDNPVPIQVEAPVAMKPMAVMLIRSGVDGTRLTLA